jgi:hypothetical protein
MVFWNVTPCIPVDGNQHFEETSYTHQQGKHGKAIPLQVLTGPEGSRRLRLPDFKTIGT